MVLTSYQNKNNSLIDILKNFKNNQLSNFKSFIHMFTQAFKNNKINTTVGLLFTIQFVILIKNIGLFTEFKIHPYLIASSLTIEIIGLFLLSPFYKDFIFLEHNIKHMKT